MQTTSQTRSWGAMKDAREDYQACLRKGQECEREKRLFWAWKRQVMFEKELAKLETKLKGYLSK